MIDSGITPAHAGKTNEWFRDENLIEDHPRSRGKDRFNNDPLELLEGSPPLTRERLIEENVPLDRVGITPAHAGKTTRWGKYAHQERDHPRSRGKDFRAYNMIYNEWGSPPLTRERQISMANKKILVRITPAHAGKTSCNICKSTTP